MTNVSAPTKLAKAVGNGQATASPYNMLSTNPELNGVPGDMSYRSNATVSMQNPRNYQEEVKQCRFFYRYDPIASTVINRMADMCITTLRNRREYASDEEVAYFNGVAKAIAPILQTVALEYLISGAAIVDYGVDRVMGSRINTKLGRKRYYFPNPAWVRNGDAITLKRKPASNDRSVWLRISDDERYFIEHQGVRSDGSEDRDAYRALVRQFPKYVELVKSGKSEILLENVKPILRKPLPSDDWPQPYLVPALASLKHKLRIKQLDYSIASKAIEAIRHVKAGDKDFPVTEDDTTLDDIKAQMDARSRVATPEGVYSLYTNHTITMEWVYPPLEALMSDGKYAEPNADIFMAMGFSRVLLVGEAFRSNSGQSITTTLGPVAALNEVRERILEWMRALYVRLADLNGFKNIPEPRFSPVVAADTVALVQFALEAGKMGVLSKNTIAQMFSTDFETESQQIIAEGKSTGDPALFDAIYNKPEPEPTAPSSGE
jgi:hypothetical protein